MNQQRRKRTLARSDSPRVVKNQVYCAAAKQNKLPFDSEAKAERHLSFLRAEDYVNGDMPVRSYHCHSCMCWHVTSKQKISYFTASTQTQQ